MCALDGSKETACDPRRDSGSCLLTLELENAGPVEVMVTIEDVGHGN